MEVRFVCQSFEILVDFQLVLLLKGNMPALRRKIWVALFFTLITIGQGFALSYVMNLPKLHQIESAQSQGPVPGYLLVCGHDFNDTLRENPTPHQRSHHELLSLRSDPFLPSRFSATPLLFESAELSEQVLPLKLHIQNLFDKPPKFFS